MKAQQETITQQVTQELVRITGKKFASNIDRNGAECLCFEYEIRDVFLNDLLHILSNRKCLEAKHDEENNTWIVSNYNLEELKKVGDLKTEFKDASKIITALTRLSPIEIFRFENFGDNNCKKHFKIFKEGELFGLESKPHRKMAIKNFNLYKLMAFNDYPEIVRKMEQGIAVTREEIDKLLLIKDDEKMQKALQEYIDFIKSKLIYFAEAQSSNRFPFLAKKDHSVEHFFGEYAELLKHEEERREGWIEKELDRIISPSLQVLKRNALLLDLKSDDSKLMEPLLKICYLAGLIDMGKDGYTELKEEPLLEHIKLSVQSKYNIFQLFDDIERKDNIQKSDQHGVIIEEFYNILAGIDKENFSFSGEKYKKAEKFHRKQTIKAILDSDLKGADAKVKSITSAWPDLDKICSNKGFIEALNLERSSKATHKGNVH